MGRRFAPIVWRGNTKGPKVKALALIARLVSTPALNLKALALIARRALSQIRAAKANACPALKARLKAPTASRFAICVRLDITMETLGRLNAYNAMRVITATSMALLNAKNAITALLSPCLVKALAPLVTMAVILALKASQFAAFAHPANSPIQAASLNATPACLVNIKAAAGKANVKIALWVLTTLSLVNQNA
jgi:hypothetical protein